MGEKKRGKGRRKKPRRMRSSSAIAANIERFVDRRGKGRGGGEGIGLIT